jgi:hypothetical protein
MFLVIFYWASLIQAGEWAILHGQGDAPIADDLYHKIFERAVI